jgi:putative transposase
VSERASDIVAAKRKAGESFTGFDRAMKRPRHHSAGDRMSSGGHKSEMRPHVTARDEEKRIAALQDLEAFWTGYAAALERWRAGDRDVMFPYGTYKMRVLHNANIEPRPP